MWLVSDAKVKVVQLFTEFCAKDSVLATKLSLTLPVNTTRSLPSHFYAESSMAVFFNLGSAEPRGSTNSLLGSLKML